MTQEMQGLVADETGGRVVVIDPLSDDWYSSTTGIIRTLKGKLCRKSIISR